MYQCGQILKKERLQVISYRLLLLGSPGQVIICHEYLHFVPPLLFLLRFLK